MIGTPQYMSPEMIIGKNYSFSTDFWSLGILWYELITGYVPFGETCEDPYEIFQMVIGSPVNWPGVFYSRDKGVKKCISELLDKNWLVRVGGGMYEM
jgi:serine/threonine protein kinase